MPMSPMLCTFSFEKISSIRVITILELIKIRQKTRLIKKNLILFGHILFRHLGFLAPSNFWIIWLSNLLASNAPPPFFFTTVTVKLKEFCLSFPFFWAKINRKCLTWYILILKHRNIVCEFFASHTISRCSFRRAHTPLAGEVWFCSL